MSKKRGMVVRRMAGGGGGSEAQQAGGQERGGGGLTGVGDEGNLEERADHTGHIAGLVIAQGMPLGNHQSVHGHSHITVAEGEQRHEHKEPLPPPPSPIAHLSRNLLLLISPRLSSCSVGWQVNATASWKKFCHSWGRRGVLGERMAAADPALDTHTALKLALTVGLKKMGSWSTPRKSSTRI